MKMNKLTGLLAGALCLAFASANSFAVAVSLENESDSHEGVLLFNAPDNSVIDNGLSNTINLGLNMFGARADDVGVPAAAFDTTSMEIVAPTDYVITGIRFVEEATVHINNGFIFAAGSLEVNNITSNLGGSSLLMEDGLLGPAPIVFDSGLIAIDNASSIDVSVTNSLVASIFGEPGIGGTDAFAEVVKNAAYFEVTLEAAPVPLPPAVWLLGSAIFGMIAVRRKNNA